MIKRFRQSISVAVIGSMFLAQASDALGQIRFAGLGDSIGEGVQSADANEWTQPYSYLNLLALQMGAEFPLPLIRTNPLGVVGNPNGRFRIDPSLSSPNLAFSGADVFSLLYERADATAPSEIDSEADLVLWPRVGSQIEIVSAGMNPSPAVVACWVGNNDVLAAVTAFDQLDASQMTSLNDFFADFFLIAAYLKSMNSQVVFANIPDISSIGFLVDRNDLKTFLGSDLGLPPGHRTTIVTMLMIGLGLKDPGVLQDQDYILDTAEIAAIRERTQTFNQIIHVIADYFEMGVVDIYARFREYREHPPVFQGVPLTTRFLGGLFSLDGVHPSNIAHALIANEFISVFNQTYGLNIAPLTESELNVLFANDPFVDLNGNGRVRGRPGAGQLELMSALFGLSGDSEGFSMESQATAKHKAPPRERALRSAGSRFLEEYRRTTGIDLASATADEIEEAFRELFGLQRFHEGGR